MKETKCLTLLIEIKIIKGIGFHLSFFLASGFWLNLLHQKNKPATCLQPSKLNANLDLCTDTPCMLTFNLLMRNQNFALWIFMLSTRQVLKGFWRIRQTCFLWGFFVALVSRIDARVSALHETFRSSPTSKTKIVIHK